MTGIARIRNTVCGRRLEDEVCGALRGENAMREGGAVPRETTRLGRARVEWLKKSPGPGDEGAVKKRVHGKETVLAGCSGHGKTAHLGMPGAGRV